MSCWACCLCAGCEGPSSILTRVLCFLVVDSPVVMVLFALIELFNSISSELCFLALLYQVIVSLFQLNLWLNPSQQRGGERRTLANQEGRKTEGKTRRKALPVKWNTKTFASMENAFTENISRWWPASKLLVPWVRCHCHEPVACEGSEEKSVSTWYRSISCCILTENLCHVT